MSDLACFFFFSVFVASIARFLVRYHKPSVTLPHRKLTRSAILFSISGISHDSGHPSTKPLFEIYLLLVCSAYSVAPMFE